MRHRLLAWTCCFVAMTATFCLRTDSAVAQANDPAPLRTPDGHRTCRVSGTSPRSPPWSVRLRWRERKCCRLKKQRPLRRRKING